MASERELRARAYRAKAEAELSGLAARGVVAGGNAFSSVLLAKGELTDEEAGGAAAFSGADGAALKASLARLGYAPEDWATLLTCEDDLRTPLAPELLREAVCTLDPSTVVLCDEPAADAFREAYADELSAIGDFQQAMLVPGHVADVLGMRVMALGGFAAALASGDKGRKQAMWHWLKQLPPLAEPF